METGRGPISAEDLQALLALYQTDPADQALLHKMRRPDPSLPADPGDGPTLHRLALAAWLRRLRIHAGITMDDAARVIRVSKSKLSRMELGRSGVREEELTALLDAYGAGEVEAGLLWGHRVGAQRPGWWHGDQDVLSPLEQDHLGLEEAAMRIRLWAPHFLPALLQTAAYARAVLPLEDPRLAASRDRLERAVQVRLTRQQILTRPGLPRQHLWAVVDEAALRRPVAGDAATMTEQLTQLAAAAARPNVTVQILPLAVPAPTSATALTLLSFRAQDIPDIVYTSDLTGPALIDRPEILDRARLQLDRLCCAAHQAGTSLALLHELAHGSPTVVPTPRRPQAADAP